VCQKKLWYSVDDMYLPVNIIHISQINTEWVKDENEATFVVDFQLFLCRLCPSYIKDENYKHLYCSSQLCIQFSHNILKLRYVQIYIYKGLSTD
jgi:hypothetical protein